MGKRRKRKTVKRAAELGETDTTPRSFIFQRGIVGKTLLELVQDMRKVMQPYTATNLKVTKSNALKDFVHVAGPYGISHFIVFSKTDLAPYMKICRLPRGPTLTFKVNEFSLMKDVVAILKRPKSGGKQFQYPCLAVLNSFGGGSDHMKLMTTIFQNMFPPIKVQKVNLSEVRRCSVFNYDKENDCIDFRHYNIEAKPTGVSRGVKKLLKNKLPNLGTLNDISDFMTGAAYLSESEGEEPTESKVVLPQNLHGRGNMKSHQSAIRLTEMGPRLQLQLIKIEEGVCEGEVLYHKYEERTEEEKIELKKQKEKAKQLKEQRKKEQEKNVERKKELKEEHRQRSLAGMKRKADEEEENNSGEDADQEESEDDDAEYYKNEVGEEPEKELFRGKTTHGRNDMKRKFNKKKPKSIPMKSSKDNRKNAKTSNAKTSNVKFNPKRKKKQQ